MTDNEKDKSLTQATITEALPNAMFRVEFEDCDTAQADLPESAHIAYLAGKMRMHRIKVLVGDKVLVKIDEYGGKSRIVRRL